MEKILKKMPRSRDQRERDRRFSMSLIEAGAWLLLAIWIASYLWIR